MNKILLIGCGHMGSALLKAWSTQKNFSYLVVDPIKYRKINKEFNNKVRAFKSIDEIKNLDAINIVIFAIKPQIATKVLITFKKFIFKKNTIFVSIVAGKKINFFTKYLHTSSQLIRVMPNMPAIINEGMSCLISNKNVSKKNKNMINALFSKVGKTLWLNHETEINQVTAISGSGPGYVFFIIDAFEKAASNLGLDLKITNQLVHQTLKGSIDLLLKEKQTASKLANNIAIKGGTTEAALNEFKKNKILHKIFKKAVYAAYRKSLKLSQ